MKTCGLRNAFLWLLFLGLVLCPNARKCSRGPDDGPSQPTQIPCHRHPVQLARLRRALPVSAGLSHELRPPLWGVVGLAPTRHQLAYTDQPGLPKKRWTDSFGSFPSTVFYLCAKVIWGVGPNAGGWGERLPTLIFSSVRIDRYQIFLCRHISPRGLALFICSLNSRDAYMCVSVLHTLIACLLMWKMWPLWSHWECLSVTSQEMFGSICDDFTGRFTEDSQEVLNDICDPPQEGRKPISQLWFHRNAIKWQGELLFVHPTCVLCFDLDKVEMKCSF